MSKAIVQYDLNEKFVRKWDCMKDVERQLGIRVGNISACCTGRKKLQVDLNGNIRRKSRMKSFLIWDKYDETYREVMDVKELVKYIQDLIIKIKNQEVKDMFITASQGKLDTIIVLEKILDQFNQEEE